MNAMLIFVLFIASIAISSSFRISKLHNRQIIKSTTKLRNMLELAEGDFENSVIKRSVDHHVIVDFYAEWCGPCKLVGPIFKALADELTDVKFVKVNTDIHEDTVDSFNIQGLPHFGIFKDGVMIASHSGLLSRDKMREFINNNVQTSQSQ